jgi:hypothetical protein
MKLPIIETPDYILAVSDEGIKRNDVLIYPLTDAIFKWDGNMPTRNEDRKIIAHLPKDDAKELNLPLLPEMVVKDDVEKLACNIYNLPYEEYLHIREHISQTRECIEEEYSHLGLEIPNKYFDVISFISGYNYKAATKVYSEEDLRKAFNFGANEGYNYKDLESIGEEPEELSEKDWNNFVKTFKQPKTPKWFIAETVCDQCLDDETADSCYCNFGNHKTVLKTTTNSQGQQVLVGTYEP